MGAQKVSVMGKYTQNIYGKKIKKVLLVTHYSRLNDEENLLKFSSSPQFGLYILWYLDDSLRNSGHSMKDC